MAEEKQKNVLVRQGYPLAPASAMPRCDVESSTTYESLENKRKKRFRCLAYITLFAVFQTAIILVFVFTFLRVKTPKVRLDEVSITNVGNGQFRLAARVLVRNRNFGRYKFDSSVASIRAEGSTIGQFVIPDGRARARTTKKDYVISDISTSRTGVVTATAEAKVRGRVSLIRVFKKRKNADMSCTMLLDLSTNSVRDVKCK